MKKFSIKFTMPLPVVAKSHKKCCGVFHKGAYPKDPLTLMKSRYSAFAVGDIKSSFIKTSTFQT